MPFFTKFKATPDSKSNDLHHNNVGRIKDKNDQGAGGRGGAGEAAGGDYRTIGEDELKKYGYNPRYRIANSTQISTRGYNHRDKGNDHKHGNPLDRDKRKRNEHEQLNQTGGLDYVNNAQDDGLSDTESVESLIKDLQESKAESHLSEIGQVLEKQKLLIDKLLNERKMVAKRSDRDENVSREGQTEPPKNNDGRNYTERRQSMKYDKENQTDEIKPCPMKTQTEIKLRQKETQTVSKVFHCERTQTDDMLQTQADHEREPKEKNWGLLSYIFPPTGLTKIDSTGLTKIDSTGLTKKDSESQTDYLCDLDETVHPSDIRWLQESYLYAQGEIERLKAELLRRANTSQSSQQPAPPVIRKVCVEIYNPGQATDIVLLMEESLKRDLQARLSAHNVKIEFNTTSGGGGKLGAPSIVLCPNFSRLGTDVNSAFSGLQDSGDGTVLLVIYYKEEHNLPKIKSEQILSQFNRLGAILDMAFIKDKGFYPTNINHQSFEYLVHFVLRFIT
ncbi:hypothetical protein SNE40_008750 [Patella caerulea]|uniref:Uncharacterized protein n=1 Tax=Patella caerulea TaxID=87958 RepID=A0AAN8JQL9_PATCE